MEDLDLENMPICFTEAEETIEKLRTSHPNLFHELKACLLNFVIAVGTVSDKYGVCLGSEVFFSVLPEDALKNGQTPQV